MKVSSASSCPVCAPRGGLASGAIPSGETGSSRLSGNNTRVPWRATVGSEAYEGINPLPVSVLLENVRSLYNVGAFFRTADAVALDKLYLTGITGYPPQNMTTKTALGAEETV